MNPSRQRRESRRQTQATVASFLPKRCRVATRAAALPLALSMLAILAGCEQGQELPPQNVILVTIDTLRADHLGSYGYPRDTSPFIDSVARDGALFDRAFSASATTAPSHASIFTGTYPAQHGIRENHIGVIPDHLVTLAEHFASNGWETAAFTSASAPFRTGRLDRGFSRVDYPNGFISRQANATADAALDWVETRDPTAPLFLWLHFWDPHSPYAPMEPYTSSTDSEAEDFVRFVKDHHRVNEQFFAEDDHNILELMNAYDGEILAVDTALARFFSGFRAKYSEVETVTIITSDHGEGLGNHGWLLHGKNIYNEQVRVPLILHSSGNRIAPGRFAEVTTHLDLFPTLMELLEVEEDLALGSAPGHSLWPLLEGRNELAERAYAFSERRRFSSSAPPDSGDHPPTTTAWPSLHNLVDRAARANYESGEKLAAQDDRFKFIFWTAGGSELYDLESDPYETTNLLGSGLEAEERLRRAIEYHVRELAGSTPEEAPSAAAKVLDELRALGYIH